MRLGGILGVCTGDGVAVGVRDSVAPGVGAPSPPPQAANVNKPSIKSRGERGHFLSMLGTIVGGAPGGRFCFLMILMC